LVSCLEESPALWTNNEVNGRRLTENQARENEDLASGSEILDNYGDRYVWPYCSARTKLEAEGDGGVCEQEGR
jgi:hypothetical protein